MSFLKYERLAEDLYLDKDIKVSGKIVKYLKDYQIHGIRYLYKNYKKKSGCILNDESKLGKCLIVSVFIGCLKSIHKTLIICKNKDKIGLWMFHLEILTGKKIGLDADVGIIDVSSIENVDQNQWNYIVLDERGSNLFSSNDFKLIERINCSTKLVLLTEDIIENLKHLYIVSQFCNRDEVDLMTFSDMKDKYLLPSISDSNYVKKRENLQNLCRDFRLRRYVKKLKNLPLEEPTVFNSLYDKWKKINFKETKIEIPVIPVVQSNSSNLFDFVSSGNELKISNVNSEPDETINIFETYKSYNKELNSDNPEESKIPKITEAKFEESSFELFLSEDEISPSTNESESFLNHNVYMGGDDLFLNKLLNSQTSTKSSQSIHKFIFGDSNKLIQESSAEVEILEQKNSVVIVSSEEIRPLRSPDLFSDSENDDIDNPMKFSTPINSLLNSDNNKFSPKTNDKTDIFEITENEIFPNVIKINSDTEMSPLRFTESDDDEDPRPDLSKTIDFNLLYSSVFAEKSNLNETLKRKSPENSCEKTPSSAEAVFKESPKCSAKSKQTTPKGWFTKQYREDGSSNPKRRRKLELSFKNTSLESCTLASQRKTIKGRNRIVISSDEDF